MAAPAGTWTRYDTVGEREDLSDVIYNIDPSDTPFMSGIGRGPKASQTLTEWQTDTLAPVDVDNAHLEGGDATFATPPPTVRLGNFTQIFRKTLIVSGTLEATNRAGRRSEKAYQMSKRSIEIKRDIEVAIIARNGGGVAGNITTPRRLASLLAFVRTNVELGATGANPAAPAPVPAAGRTDGTQRAFTETILRDVIRRAYGAGGKPKVLMVGPVNKTRVSSFTGIATRNFDLSNTSPKPTAVIAAVDVYVSDFAILRVVPNRFQRERDAWLIDFEGAELRYLRPFKTVELSKTGDSERTMLLGELTLQVKNEAMFGLAADLTVT